MKKLSLITPLYNTPRKYLKDVLKSAAPYADDVELILVNDSPDNRRLRIFLDGLREPHIKVLHNPENLGIFNAYYRGYQHARGEYCCILDHDDVFDPKHVLDAIAEKPDLIYTDEYKFSNGADGKEIRQPPFLKPDFDILSAVFYLYTHHVTVVKRRIVQEQLARYTVPGRYTSIFDIHSLFEYLKAYTGRKLHVVHLLYADYGWRVHENSTAQSLAQKPAGYFERLKKVEEFLRFFGETPLLSIDPRIGHLVDGMFLSMWDLTGYPMVFHEFSKLLSEKKEIRGTQLVLELEEGSYTEKDYRLFFEMLKRLPAKYLLSQNAFPLKIPSVAEMPKVDPHNWERQIPNVPFISGKEGGPVGLLIYERKKGRPGGKSVRNVLMKK